MSVSISRYSRIVFACAWLFFPGCGEMDTGTGITSDRDYTLTLQVVDRLVHVGDKAALTLRLKRTDNSNLENGLNGSILITTSVHGAVDLSSVGVSVGNNQTREFVRNLVFTAQRSGVAEVSATYLDATATIKVLISNVDS